MTLSNVKSRDVATWRICVLPSRPSMTLRPLGLGRSPHRKRLSTRGGGHAGPRSAEVPRRRLTEAEMDGIVEHEIVELQIAAEEYEHAGDQDTAKRLRAQAVVLVRVLDAEN
jgi:hypothetical protein